MSKLNGLYTVVGGRYIKETAFDNIKLFDGLTSLITVERDYANGNNIITIHGENDSNILFKGTHEELINKFKK